MKRSVISLSVAAAFTGVVLSGAAQAQTTGLALNPQGTGHILVVPYFTTQSGNATLLTLTNTDEANGKAVKIRFRSALNSDDLYDFQVFMSPGDVWTASVSSTASGTPTLSTTDNSCTIPSKSTLNSTPFVTTRLSPDLTEAERNNLTREGYIEILNMGDVPSSTASTSLFATIKHATSGTAIGTAPCSSAILESLVYQDTRMTAPTTGLMADWIIINVPSSLTYSGDATALQVQTGGLAATGLNVYSPQSADQITTTGVTADPLYKNPAIPLLAFDIPDLSTPYYGTVTDPQVQANALSAALAATSFGASFLTNPAIQSATDWVLSMPTRRYYAAVDYADAGLVTNFDDYSVTSATMFRKFSASAGGNLRGDGIDSPVCVRLDSVKFYNQEELSPAGSSGIGVSPGVPTDPPQICGEVSVFSINGSVASPTDVLKSTVGMPQLITVPGTGTKFIAGWGTLTSKNLTANTGGTEQGLPIIGRSFLKAVNPGVSTGGNYGASSSMRKLKLPVAP